MNRLLDALASSVRRAPGSLVVLTIVLTAVLGGVSSQAVQDDGFENFAPDNEVTAALERIGDEFGSAVDPVQLVVTATDGPLLGADGLAAAAELRARLLADDDVAAALVPPASSAVVTYADLALQAAAAQQLDPADLADDAVVGLHTAALEQLPAQASAQVTRLLAGDGDVTATVGAGVVLLDGEAGQDVRLAAVEAMPALFEGLDGVEVTALDFRLLMDEVNEAITADLGRLLGLAFLLIIAILVAIFRRPVDVVASLLGLVFTIVWMQGLSTLLGPGFLGLTGGMNEMTMAIPILLVGLGVDYGIHLTMRYREERGTGREPTGAVTGAIGAVGAALALATVTTVVGFLTNVTNPLPPLRDFGVFAAVGVLSAFLIMTTFVPAVRLWVDRWLARRGKLADAAQRGDHRPSLLGRGAAVLAPAATHHPLVVLVAAGLLTVLGGTAATNLSTEFSQTEFFPEDSEALETIELVDEAFGGALTETTALLVTGDLDQPGVLAALDEVERRAADVTGVRRVDDRAEADSVLRRVEAVLNGPVAAGGEGATATDDRTAAPEAAGPEDAPDPAAVQELVAVAGAAGVGTPDGPSDDAQLGPVVDALLAVDPSASSLVSPPDALLVELSSSSGDQVDALRAGLDEATAPLRDLGLEVTAASDAILVEVVMDELRGSQVTGLALTLVASAIILSLAFWFRVREPWLGVLAIAAVGLVVAWVFGLMATVGIPFNVMTAMVSALAIGIGVPFGIHVVNRFLEDRDRHDDLTDAMRATLQHTGGALVGSALTTIAGFGSLVLSAVRPFQQFGAVLAMTIGLALVSSVVVLPAMLALYTKVRTRRDGRGPSREPERRAAGVG